MGIGEQFWVCEKHCLLFSLSRNCAFFLNLCPIKIERKKLKRSNKCKSNSWSFWYSSPILQKCQVVKCRWFKFTAALRVTFLGLKLEWMKVMHGSTSSGAGQTRTRRRSMKARNICSDAVWKYKLFPSLALPSKILNIRPYKQTNHVRSQCIAKANNSTNTLKICY